MIGDVHKPVWFTKASWSLALVPFDTSGVEVQSNRFPVQTLKQKCSCSEVISLSFQIEPVKLGSSFRNVTKY